MNVLPLKKYCEVEGITTEAVKKRVREGVWKMGREVLRIKGFKTLFVDVEAVEQFFRDAKNQDPK